MRNSIAEFFVWLFSWFSLGLTTGFFFGGHAWQLLPFIGIFVGLIAGIIYSILSFIYRAKWKQGGIPVAATLGFFASASTVPVLVMLNVQMVAILVFVAAVGPLTGVFTNFCVQRMYRNETTS